MICRVEVLSQTPNRFSLPAVAALVEAVLEAEGVRGNLDVVFVDEVDMARLNQRYRHEPGPTDVLSFREKETDDEWLEWESEEAAKAEAVTADAGEAEAGRAEAGRAEAGSLDARSCSALGEMAVCPQLVEKYAAEEGAPPGRQLGWTVIHGTLHLLGYDHELDQGQMREREHVLLEQLQAAVEALDVS